MMDRDGMQACISGSNPRLRTPAPLSPDPLAQLGLAKTDVHAGADTTNGSGVK